MSLFASVGEGYAKSRPPVHSRVIDRLRARMSAPVTRALDVGCGAGLSTRALEGVARERYGLEPAVDMLRWTPAVAPQAEFIAGMAEQMPVRERSIDLITAAGSLNFCDIEAFFPEARRVLADNGTLIVYDFNQGRRFSDSPALNDWFAEFARRYPRPSSAGRKLDPDILAALHSGFRLTASERFDIAVTLDHDFYVPYLMTEVNVTCAVQSGEPADAIHEWCAETLRPVFDGRPRDVLFPGYIVWMVPEV
ncbi:MAG: methyltransferase domain-containing protein [Bryobacteraceae bacterium]